MQRPGRVLITVSAEAVLPYMSLPDLLWVPAEHSSSASSPRRVSSAGLCTRTGVQLSLGYCGAAGALAGAPLKRLARKESTRLQHLWKGPEKGLRGSINRAYSGLEEQIWVAWGVLHSSRSSPASVLLT